MTIWDNLLAEMEPTMKWIKTTLAKRKINARAREWYANHRDTRLASQKKWVANNREKCRAIARKWHKNNPEKVSMAVRRWQKRNPDKMKLYRRCWYANSLAFKKKMREKGTAARRAEPRKLCSCGAHVRISYLDKHTASRLHRYRSKI
jgi:hypothetical protein